MPPGRFVALFPGLALHGYRETSPPSRSGRPVGLVRDWIRHALDIRALETLQVAPETLCDTVAEVAGSNVVPV